MKITPIADRVLVEVIPPDTATRGGIIIPDKVQDKPNLGIVVARGEGRTTEKGVVIPMGFDAGDKVLFQKYQGTPHKIEGRNLLILYQDHIHAVIED